jgi:hypothetical protein
MQLHAKYIHSLTAVILVVLGTLASSSSHAATPTLPPTPAEQLTYLAGKADLVIRGRVTAQTARWDEAGTTIVTDSDIDVHYLLGGELRTFESLRVRTLGGELPEENIGLGVSHTAELHVGDEVLLFLRRDAPSTAWHVTGGEIGAFTVGNGKAFSAWSGVTYALSDVVQRLDGAQLSAAVPQGWQELEEQAMAAAAPLQAEEHVNTGIRWPGNAPNVPYLINLNSRQMADGDGDEAAFLAAIVDATATWTETPGADIVFTNAGPTSATAVEQRNGLNEAIFQPAGQNGILGQTRFWYNPQTGDALEIDVWFNDSYDFDTTGQPDSDEIDLQSVALHEFGHWLVLGHDDNAAAIMYYAISAGLTKRTLHPSDIAGIEEIYPCEAPPCQGPSTPEDPPTATPTEIAPELPTETPTEVPTATPTIVVTATATATPAETSSAPPTATATVDPAPPPNDPQPRPTVTPTALPTESPPSATPTATMTPESPASVAQLEPGQAAVVELGGDEEQPALILNVPANAVDQTTLLTYSAQDEYTLGTAIGAYAGARFTLSATQAGTPVDALAFLAAVRFRVAFPAPSGDLDPTRIRIYYRADAGEAWQPAACGPEGIDASTRQAYADICRAGEFALYVPAVVPGEMSNPIFLPVIRR